MDEAPPDLPAQIGAAVATTVGFVDDDRRRARVLYVEALGNEALNRRRISAGHDITSFIETDAVERRGPPPEGERIGALTSAVLVGGISEVLTAWLDGRLDVDPGRADRRPHGAVRRPDRHRVPDGDAAGRRASPTAS